MKLIDIFNDRYEPVGTEDKKTAHAQGRWRTGGAITALACGTGLGRGAHAHAEARTGLPDDDVLNDVLVVRLPEGEVTMPVSRREVLAGLSIGALGSALADQLERVLVQLDLGGDPLASFERAFTGFSSAARSLPPTRLIDGMIGQVALLDGLRRRAPATRRRAYAVMQARYAESLSWLCEEASDAAGALYWVDRAAQWAQTAQWAPMVGYTFVRRSMLVINFTGDGLRAVDAALPVLDMPDLSWVRGLACKEMAMGYALAGQPEASARALEDAMLLLDTPGRDDEAHLGQRSVVGDDLYAVYRTTCDIYLGRGEARPRLRQRLPGGRRLPAGLGNSGCQRHSGLALGGQRNPPHPARAASLGHAQ